MFGIEIETCEQCGGPAKVIASIEDPAVIGRILGHLASRELPASPAAVAAGILGWQTQVRDTTGSYHAMLYVAIGLFITGAVMLLGLGRYPGFQATGRQAA